MPVVKDKKRLKQGMYINGLSVFKHNISSYSKGNYCLQAIGRLPEWIEHFILQTIAVEIYQE
jgi:hypothetical protein